jgi:hypothetical protein
MALQPFRAGARPALRVAPRPVARWAPRKGRGSRRRGRALGGDRRLGRLTGQPMVGRSAVDELMVETLAKLIATAISLLIKKS